MIKVAINGFGRIGRLVFREMIERENFDILAINDITDAKTLAHLLKYDSVHKKFKHEIKVEDNYIIIKGKKIRICAERNPEDLPWKELDIDIVVESTGIFRTQEGALKHVKAGAKKVIISAPAKGEVDATIVMGVNDAELKAEHQVISNASCTTNCLAPVMKILVDKFGVERATMTTIHSYTNDQKILDLPHSDLRRARSAAINIIPTTTGAASAAGKVIPELLGKIDGMALRVPTPDGSLVDVSAILKKEVSAEDINKAIKEAADTKLKGILEFSNEPLVSSDIIGNPHSSVFDSLCTKVDKNLVKLISWYDNEMGYSVRVVDLAEFWFSL